MPDLVTYLYCTPILKWYVVGCGPKKWILKYIYLEEFGLYAQNKTTFHGSTINVIVETCMTI